jgi:hypothetical protein
MCVISGSAVMGVEAEAAPASAVLSTVSADMIVDAQVSWSQGADTKLPAPWLEGRQAQGITS